MINSELKKEVTRICDVGGERIDFSAYCITVSTKEGDMLGGVKLELKSLKELCCLKGFKGKIRFKGASSVMLSRHVIWSVNMSLNLLTATLSRRLFSGGWCLRSSLQ